MRRYFQLKGWFLLEMQLSLQSTIKPQVIQHLHLLQLTTIELQAMIQKKALENPLIDLEESTFDRPYEWLGSAAIKAMVNLGSSEVDWYEKKVSILSNRYDIIFNFPTYKHKNGYGTHS